ncbi:hypothetical protein O1611_g170 [Lasiodiplodia mahajangana]|uniref:Uncharacterized protein n=1 Tax=Lasiodiplodia mahajangana TaxID=1108764 RepID=A0ACC2K0Z3_9PEZI|nr:hypothetical protein O1611_g170 [Lasiodiplodia mahajangana]
MSSLPALTPEQEARFYESRQPQLWASLGIFLVINNVAIIARLWATRTSTGTRSPILAEDILIILSGVFVNAIIPNLMVATHYGLGLHVYAVNARDPNYPTNLSHTFRRLFLVSNPKLRIFWWANFVFIILWFIGATGFYLFQCQPVQYYFMRYYVRFPHPEKNDLSHLKGQCDVTAVLNVSLPVIFSFISDIALMILPIWAVSTLKMNKTKKRGLLAVFGVGGIACVLELARILALNLNTDDKDDTSYGVVLFLILTAAEETTAVVCACLPVVAPRLYQKFKGKTIISGRIYENNKSPMSSLKWSNRGFKRVISLNPIGTIVNTERVSGDDVPLTYVQITGSGYTVSETESKITTTPTKIYPPRPSNHDTGNLVNGVGSSGPGVIHVRTDIHTCVTDTPK